jgi:hypothetical protein
VLAEIDPRTIVIPGHGAVATYQDMLDYVSMLRTIRDRIGAMISGSASLAEVFAAKPTAEWDEAQGDPTLVIDRIYHSLLRNR